MQLNLEVSKLELYIVLYSLRRFKDSLFLARDDTLRFMIESRMFDDFNAKEFREFSLDNLDELVSKIISRDNVTS